MLCRAAFIPYSTNFMVEDSTSGIVTHLAPGNVSLSCADLVAVVSSAISSSVAATMTLLSAQSARHGDQWIDRFKMFEDYMRR